MSYITVLFFIILPTTVMPFSFSPLGRVADGAEDGAVLMEN